MPSEGFDLRLMSWGDGAGVPSSGKSLVIVGIDNTGLLHIRIFDAGGNLVTDTDETKVPGTRAGEVSILKQRVPGFLPPRVLTGDEKALLISEVKSITGPIPSEDPGSVSKLLIIIKESDESVEVAAAVRVLWEQYFDRLVRLARSRLRHPPDAMQDPEDVALSAIDSFCRRAADGQFPRLDDRHDLWRILMTIAARKAAGLFRRPRPWTHASGALDRIIGREPTPELAAMFADELRHLLESLPDDTYRTIAQKKFEGYTNDEIAASLGCCTKNVEFKLRNIRATWRELLSEGPAAE
jgi:DNA-directed RNA polymerase specialized sigma24 family protein